MGRRRGRKPRTPRENNIADTMRKFKHKTLRSGTGRKGEHRPYPVAKREQAIAIALSKAEKKYGPYVCKTPGCRGNKGKNKKSAKFSYAEIYFSAPIPVCEYCGFSMMREILEDEDDTYDEHTETEKTFYNPSMGKTSLENYSQFASDSSSNNSLTPPESVAKVAARALNLRAEQSSSNKGGTAVGVTRANQLKNRKKLSPSTIKRMKSYFERHAVDKQADGFRQGEDGYPSKGRQAWDLWGGDAAQSWVNKVAAQLDKKHKKTE
jgi:Family of unknown function (DUF6496)